MLASVPVWSTLADAVADALLTCRSLLQRQKKRKSTPFLRWLQLTFLRSLQKRKARAMTILWWLSAAAPPQALHAPDDGAPAMAMASCCGPAASAACARRWRSCDGHGSLLRHHS